MDLPISIPIGKVIRCTTLYRELALKIGDGVFPSNLIKVQSGRPRHYSWDELVKFLQC